ncbi:MAG: hypothetical protein RI988_3513 [Pseudomonadota bacterium]|jgi:hypothetical protein
MTDTPDTSNYRHFLRMGADGKLTTPLTVTIDGDRLVLEKREGFGDWRADTTPVAPVFGNAPMAKRDADMYTLVNWVRCWMDGEELP